VATYPGVIATHERPTIARNIEEHLVDQIVRELTESDAAPSPADAEARPDERSIVFTGSFEDVNDHFLREQWSDGLPIVPPTIEKVEAFLRFTDRSPDEVIGVLHPSLTAATVWNVAVNGVMAGCRPEYMPVLLAIVEAMA